MNKKTGTRWAEMLSNPMLSANQETTSLYNSFMVKVYTTMGFGLLVTALVAIISYVTGFYSTFMQSTGTLGYFIVFIVEIAVAATLYRKLRTLSVTTAHLMFYIYAAITGFTFTVIFYAYDIGIVGFAFAMTAILFFSCAIFGHYTRMDMSRLSPLLFGGLTALIFANIIGWFIPALRESLVLSYISIILFMLYTMYDVQMLKKLFFALQAEGDTQNKLIIYGALNLYLDFINLFLEILKVLGSSSSKSKK